MNPVGFHVNDAMLAPLVFLHGLFAIEFLVAYLTLKRAIIAMRSFMNLKDKLKNMINSFKRKNMRLSTYPKIAFLSVLLAAYFAGKWFFASMGH